MASIWTLQLHVLSFQHRISSNVLELRKTTDLGFYCGYLNSNHRKKILRKFVLSALSDVSHGIQDEVIKSEKDKVVNTRNTITRLQQSISSHPSLIFLTRRTSATNSGIGLCLAAMFLVIVVKIYTARKSRSTRPGSVADLVRRGQLRSDRRGMYDS